MHEELFADDALSTPNDRPFGANDNSLGTNDNSSETNNGSPVPEAPLPEQVEVHLEWIDEARKEAFERKTGRAATDPLANERLADDLLGDDPLEFIDKFDVVDAAVLDATGLDVQNISYTHDSTDEKLFLRYRDGDDRAFFAIYERYKSEVYAYCAHVLFSVGLSRESVEDTFQDVFMRLVQYRHTFTGGDFKPWLFTVTRHSCISAKKLAFRASAGMEYAGSDENFEEMINGDSRAEITRGDDPLEQMAKQEQTALLLAAIAKLPDEFREALVLSEYNGMSYEEIGRITGTSLSTIRIRIYRAKSRLRKMLLPVIGDSPNGKKVEEKKV